MNEASLAQRALRRRAPTLIELQPLAKLQNPSKLSCVSPVPPVCLGTPASFGATGGTRVPSGVACRYCGGRASFQHRPGETRRWISWCVDGMWPVTSSRRWRRVSAAKGKSNDPRTNNDDPRTNDAAISFASADGCLGHNCLLITTTRLPLPLSIRVLVVFAVVFQL